MKVYGIAAALVLMLSGCGQRGTEDFAIPVKRPVQAVYTPFSAIALPPEAQALFPGLKLEHSKPSENEVLYTIPGDGDFPAKVLLRFESTANGKETLVHATVDVPAVHATIGGQPKVVREGLVEMQLRNILKNSVNQFQSGSSGDGARSEFTQLLAAVAIATNKSAIASAMEMVKDPTKAIAALGALGGDLFERYDPEHDAETVDSAEGREASPGLDPNAAIEREEYARARSNAREMERVEAASAPGDAAEGADTSGDNAEGDAPSADY